jgi:fucose 4-O-acetylase-like acetyltransferase
MMTSVQGFSQVSQNTLSSRLLLAYFAEILPFQMPLLFLIAGYSAAVSLPEKLGLKPRRSRRLFLCYNILGEVI